MSSSSLGLNSSITSGGDYSEAEPQTNRKEKDQAAVAVLWTRILVVTVLLLSAVIVGALAYDTVSRNEQEDFENRFDENARETLTGAAAKAAQAFEMASKISATFSSFATASGAALPFFTLRNFEAFGQSMRHVSGATLFAYTPYLTNEAFRTQWEQHSQDNSDWVQQSYRIMYPDVGSFRVNGVPEHIWREEDSNSVVDTMGPPYTPLWQTSPAPIDLSRLNLNMYRQSDQFVDQMEYIRKMDETALSPPVPVRSLLGSALPASANDTTPQSFLMHPVHSSLDPSRAFFAAAISAVIPFRVYFTNLLQNGVHGVMVVLDSCGWNHTYVINGPHVEFLGNSDLHDETYADMAVTGFLAGEESSYCRHKITIYPTPTFEEDYKTDNPVFYSIMVIALFGFATLVFVVYDVLATRRQRQTQTKANRTNEIVNQLFPQHVREKLFREDSGGSEEMGELDAVTKHKFVSDGEQRGMGDKPIAELFPEATVLFADIAGFTAWSSSREPSHVFTLLEHIFRAFDEVAQRYGVFKVETVGDCYVAVTGVPRRTKHHALAMAKFARESLDRFDHVVAGLEIVLGPDTSDLAMRFGMHSGPVTAGVLRGDRARFQLFGDTVNIAGTMEHAGCRERIQVSEQTAALLTAAGKSDWLSLRDDLVEGKGQEMLKTYWLKTKAEQASASSQTTGSQADPQDRAESLATDEEAQQNKNNESAPRRRKSRTALSNSISDQQANRDRRTSRLIDWNCELLAQLLKQVVTRRKALGVPSTPRKRLDDMAARVGDGAMVVEEVAEIISMPNFEAGREDVEHVQLSDSVLTELHQYVSVVASMYRDNPFHNFEHASHVTMSVSKLLSRIIAPKKLENGEDDTRHIEERLHDHTYGITSDPLTQFAVVLSALIHDVDHRGVPNFVLAKEDKTLASCYNGKSIAEQNSVDIAWNALLSEGFEELRAHIFADAAELKRFRQLLVNSVIATDIFDKDLGALRKNRWNKAFHEIEQAVEEDLGSRRHIDRKATIVIEHIIQASDIAHTMQHWHVYQKWNERLFAEMYKAYKTGRSDKDPSLSWYKGEIGFFDNYIIPLAKKLKECGVFGVSSDEYLNYATQNRKEWASRGEEIVAGFVKTHSRKEE